MEIYYFDFISKKFKYAKSKPKAVLKTQGAICNGYLIDAILFFSSSTAKILFYLVKIFIIIQFLKIGKLTSLFITLSIVWLPF